MRPSSATPVKSHRKHIICLLLQLFSHSFTTPSRTPSPPSAILIRCPSSCTIPQPCPFWQGAHCQRINALPASQEGTHGLEMEGVPFDWNNYLSAEGFSDIVPPELGMHGDQKGQAR